MDLSKKIKRTLINYHQNLVICLSLKLSQIFESMTNYQVWYVLVWTKFQTPTTKIILNFVWLTNCLNLTQFLELDTIRFQTQSNITHRQYEFIKYNSPRVWVPPNSQTKLRQANTSNWTQGSKFKTDTNQTRPKWQHATCIDLLDQNDPNKLVFGSKIWITNDWVNSNLCITLSYMFLYYLNE